MNYLQLTDRSTFATEEACLANGFGEGNYVPFYAKELIQGRIKQIKGNFVTSIENIPNQVGLLETKPNVHPYIEYFRKGSLDFLKRGLMQM